jgi:hypothetical protein
MHLDNPYSSILIQPARSLAMCMVASDYWGVEEPSRINRVDELPTRIPSCSLDDQKIARVKLRDGVAAVAREVPEGLRALLLKQVEGLDACTQ